MEIVENRRKDREEMEEDNNAKRRERRKITKNTEEQEEIKDQMTPAKKYEKIILTVTTFTLLKTRK